MATAGLGVSDDLKKAMAGKADVHLFMAMFKYWTHGCVAPSCPPPSTLTPAHPHTHLTHAHWVWGMACFSSVKYKHMIQTDTKPNRYECLTQAKVCGAPAIGYAVDVACTEQQLKVDSTFRTYQYYKEPVRVTVYPVRRAAHAKNVWHTAECFAS